jgi:hypothetical protein
VVPIAASDGFKNVDTGCEVENENRMAKLTVFLLKTWKTPGQDKSSETKEGQSVQ